MDGCKKTYFANEKIAIEYAKRLQETSKRKVVPNRAYLCEKCLNWHLTSLPLAKEESLGKLVQEQQKALKDRNGRIKNLEKKEIQYQDRIRELSIKVDHYRNKCVEYEKMLKK